MRIGIVGAQGVGKTTLIDACLKEELFMGYTHIPSPTRYLKTRFGMDLDNGNAEIQLATLSMQIHNSRFENAFYDRTVIDNFAYLHWYAGKGKSDLSANALNFIHNMSWELANMLDVVFIIRIAFEMENDGVRNLDPVQQKWIEEEIIKVTHELPVNPNKVFVLDGGTIDNRVLAVKQVVKNYLKGEVR
jgi:predicted ATPase